MCSGVLNCINTPVEWRSDPEYWLVLQGHPKISRFSPLNGRPDVQLDGTFEHLHPAQRKNLHLPTVFREAALPQLRHAGISPQAGDMRPRLFVSESERNVAQGQLRAFSGHPRIAVVPRSNAWIVRSVDDVSWTQFAGAMGGVHLFWLGTHAAPDGFIDLRIRDLRQLMGLVQQMDLVVTVDTGPMHIAAGLGVPLIAIVQSVDPKLRLCDGVDWEPFYPDLKCLNCHFWLCPKNKEHPPCNRIDGARLARQTIKKLVKLKETAC